MLNFTKTLYMGSAKSEGGGTPAPVDKKKYGITIDSIVGDVNANGVLQAPSGPTDLVFTGVKEVATDALLYSFSSQQRITSVSFPDLISLNHGNSLTGAFGGNPLTKALFPELVEINGSNQDVFSGCSSLSEVDFSKLEIIGSNGNISYMFSNNTALEEISFPSLKSILGMLWWSFSGTGLIRVYFPLLDNIGNRLWGCFNNTRKLTDMYFNSLKTTSFGSAVNQFDGIFDSSTAATSGAFTMHFPSNLETTIQGLTGYPNFGATSGRLTLAFDLPATE